MDTQVSEMNIAKHDLHRFGTRFCVLMTRGTISRRFGFVPLHISCEMNGSASALKTWKF